MAAWMSTWQLRHSVKCVSIHLARIFYLITYYASHHHGPRIPSSLNIQLEGIHTWRCPRDIVCIPLFARLRMGTTKEEYNHFRVTYSPWSWICQITAHWSVDTGHIFRQYKYIPPCCGVLPVSIIIIIIVSFTTIIYIKQLWKSAKYRLNGL